jgi:HD-like signal output (HDOD) protein/CheY-like chemotaxis protein
MNPKILFVDDDSRVLDSLRLSLRGQRGAWDMSFVASGREALELLAREPHDVIVSDMRMPGMDGAQLLRAVLERYPQTTRMVLSGYTDTDSSLQAVKLAHQYLSKPCRPEDLRAAIEKTLRFQKLVPDERIRTIVSGLDSLPVLPAIYTQLVSVLQDDNATLQQISDVLSRDISMCSSILRLVNSAFFGLPSQCGTVQQAVAMLGTEVIRMLVLSIHLFDAMTLRQFKGFSVKLLWEHSLRVSCCSKAILEMEGQNKQAQDECYIAGMLHDIGKLVIASNLGDSFSSILDRVQKENKLPHEVEQEVLGVSHAEIGGYLAGLWGFSEAVTEAVSSHHHPQRIECGSPSVLTAVAVADCFDHDMVRIHPDYASRPLMLFDPDGPALQERLANWRELCRENIEGAPAHG